MRAGRHAGDGPPCQGECARTPLFCVLFRFGFLFMHFLITNTKEKILVNIMVVQILKRIAGEKMKKLLIILSYLILINAIPSYANKCWIGCDFIIMSYHTDMTLYHLNLENNKGLGLSKENKITDSEKFIRIKKSSLDIYKNIIVKNDKNYDFIESYIDEMVKHRLDTGCNLYESKQYIENLITEKHGPEWAKFGIQIKIKGHDFPVLYEIVLRYSKNSFSPTKENRDIYYCTPENIEENIITSLNKQCKKFIRLIEISEKYNL